MGQRGIFQAWIGAARFAFLLLLLAPTSGAQTPDLPREACYFALQFSSPQECGSAGDFREALARRGVHEAEQDPTSDPETLHLAIKIQKTDRGYRGSLVMTAGARAERTAEAAACRELVDALALVVAVSLGVDPLGSEPRVPSRKEASLGPESSNATASEPVSHRKRESEDRRIHVRASASIFGGALTKPSLGPGLALGYEKSRASWLDWDVWAELSFAPEENAEAIQGRAHFSYLGAALRGCLAWLPGAPIHLHACGQMELGQLLARASDLDETRTANVDTFSFGPRIELRLSLPGPWGLFLAGEGSFQLSRDRFLVQDQLVHEVPALWMRGALGMSYRFGD